MSGETNRHRGTQAVASARKLAARRRFARTSMDVPSCRGQCISVDAIA